MPRLRRAKGLVEIKLSENIQELRQASTTLSRILASQKKRITKEIDECVETVDQYNIVIKMIDKALK